MSKSTICEHESCCEKVKFRVTWSDNRKAGQDRSELVEMEVVEKLLCAEHMNFLVSQSFSSVFGKNIAIKRYTGFAAMAKERHEMISRIGGMQSQHLGTGHRFRTSREAKAAAKKRYGE